MIERAKQLSENEKLQQIPYINFVSSTGDLSVVDETFDQVISCHVIEHQLDLIEHLSKVEKILNKGGLYYLIIPDKRYCFDHFLGLSTIADVLEAHEGKKTRHSLKSVIEHRALTTHNSKKKHWRGKHGDILNNLDRIKAAIEEYRTGDYIDVHAWYFQAESFKDIIEKLRALDYINFDVEQIVPTPRRANEFYVILKKG